MVFLLVLGIARGAAVGAEDVIRWDVAGQYVGEQRVVEGTVVAVRREGNVVRLAFDPQPDRFTVALIVSLFSSIPPDPERAYVGRTIRARGKIRHFHGVPEMVVRDPMRIAVVGEGTPSAGGHDFDVRDRVGRVERRLEHLEERLDAVEGEKK
jgi:hypothetical protein